MRISDWSSDVCSSDLSRCASWSCRLSVCVLTTTRSLFRTACSSAGTRYAIDFPVPVPASTARCPPCPNCSTTARAIVTCEGRDSYVGSRSGRSSALLNTDRKSDVEGKRVSVLVDLGGCRNIKQKKKHKKQN